MSFLERLERSWLLRLAVLAGVSVVLRILSFFRAVIDHDESTYIVIADSLRAGATYWVDVVDVKPIGIFLLFAGLQNLFGDSIFVMRLLAALFLALTAFFLIETKIKLGGTFRAAWASGVIYLFLNSLFTFYGVSPNTETFFGTFVIIAFWLALSFPRPLPTLLAGLLLGYGFIIKYVVLFDGVVLGLFLLVSWIQSRVWSVQKLVNLVLLAVGFVLPFAGLFGYYTALGQQETFLFHTFEVSSRYPVSASWQEYLTSVVDIHLRFLPVVFFFYVAVLNRQTLAVFKQLGILWLLLVCIPIYLPGKFFGHYFIQLFLPISLLAGEFFALPESSRPKFSRVLLQPRVGYALLAVLVVANWIMQKKDYIDRPDAPTRVATELKTQLKPEDQLYVGNYHPILYHLLDKQSPTPYVHRGLLWTPEHRHALNINLDKEVQHILNQQPDVVVVQDSMESTLLNTVLRRDYQKESLGETERGKKLYLYRLKK